MSDATGQGRPAENERTSDLMHLDAIKNRDEFHSALFRLYAASGISREDLSARSLIPASSLARVLLGSHTPSPPVLRSLLQALGVSKREIEAWTAARLRLAPEEALIPASGTTEAQQAARRDLSEAENELTDAQGLTLPALWKVTHARLDYYHQIATGQARQSFRNAQIAMGVGFILLVVFAVLALYAESTAAAVVTGALGATSAAFAAYIGRTFVRSQESAAAHLRSYFDQPLEFSRYLAAERMLNSIERLESEQRATITLEVLRGIVSASSANGMDKSAGGSEPA